MQAYHFENVTPLRPEEFYSHDDYHRGVKVISGVLEDVHQAAA
jgi:hypothetical protein